MHSFLQSPPFLFSLCAQPKQSAWALRCDSTLGPPSAGARAQLCPFFFLFFGGDAKHDRRPPLILLPPHPLLPTMASLRPFTTTLLLLLLLAVPLSQAASQPPPLPLLQALRAQAPGSWSWRGGPASGPPLRYMLELYRRAANREGRPRRGRSPGTNTVRLVQAASHGGQPWAGKVVSRGRFWGGFEPGGLCLGSSACPAWLQLAMGSPWVWGRRVCWGPHCVLGSAQLWGWCWSEGNMGLVLVWGGQCGVGLGTFWARSLLGTQAVSAPHPCPILLSPRQGDDAGVRGGTLPR